MIGKRRIFRESLLKGNSICLSNQAILFTQAVQEYLEQQVSSGNISQEEADDLLNNGSTE